MFILLLVVFVATWHFDFLFASVDGLIADLTRQEITTENEEKEEEPILIGSILENGIFRASALELEEDGYKIYKHLTEFSLDDCKEEEECEKYNGHVLWKEGEYILKIDVEEGSDYFGPFLMDKKEVLDYMKKNKYKISSSNICDSSEIIPVRKDYENLSFLGEFFTDIECGGANVEKILGEDLVTWNGGLELEIVEGSRFKEEINDLLLNNGFACVIEGEENGIESIDVSESALQDCDIYENRGAIDVVLLEELHRFASALAKSKCIDC